MNNREVNVFDRILLSNPHAPIYITLGVFMVSSLVSIVSPFLYRPTVVSLFISALVTVLSYLLLSYRRFFLQYDGETKKHLEKMREYAATWTREKGFENCLALLREQAGSKTWIAATFISEKLNRAFKSDTQTKIVLGHVPLSEYTMLLSRLIVRSEAEVLITCPHLPNRWCQALFPKEIWDGCKPEVARCRVRERFLNLAGHKLVDELETACSGKVGIRHLIALSTTSAKTVRVVNGHWDGDLGQETQVPWLCCAQVFGDLAKRLGLNTYVLDYTALEKDSKEKQINNPEAVLFSEAAEATKYNDLNVLDDLCISWKAEKKPLESPNKESSEEAEEEPRESPQENSTEEPEQVGTCILSCGEEKNLPGIRTLFEISNKAFGKYIIDYDKYVERLGDLQPHHMKELQP